MQREVQEPALPAPQFKITMRKENQLFSKQIQEQYLLGMMGAHYTIEHVYVEVQRHRLGDVFAEVQERILQLQTELGPFYLLNEEEQRFIFQKFLRENRFPPELSELISGTFPEFYDPGKIAESTHQLAEIVYIENYIVNSTIPCQAA